MVFLECSPYLANVAILYLLGLDRSQPVRQFKHFLLKTDNYKFRLLNLGLKLFPLLVQKTGFSIDSNIYSGKENGLWIYLGEDDFLRPHFFKYRVLCFWTILSHLPVFAFELLTKGNKLCWTSSINEKLYLYFKYFVTLNPFLHLLKVWRLIVKYLRVGYLVVNIIWKRLLKTGDSIFFHNCLVKNTDFFKICSHLAWKQKIYKLKVFCWFLCKRAVNFFSLKSSRHCTYLWFISLKFAQILHENGTLLLGTARNLNCVNNDSHLFVLTIFWLFPISSM